MFKTFIFGLILGVAGLATAAYFLPVVDQARETSVITVSPNGGSSESFHINIPMDRIVVGAAGVKPLPEGIVWPAELEGTQAEMYKLRNVHDAVIGVASRVVVADRAEGNAIEWVVHLPARGSLYIGMQTRVEPGADRFGQLLRGTREFSGMQGVMRERWVENETPDESSRGRIELVSRFNSVEAS